MAEPASASSKQKDASAKQASPVREILAPNVAATSDDKVMCERCGAAEMYRMHAVWRCPACGFKTDCCGW
jgi:ribosomal protein L37AE/L43A